MAKLSIAVLPGDGVGPEVTEAALAVLEAVLGPRGHSLRAQHFPIGWSAVAAGLDPLPDETLEGCLAADAAFLGAIGDPASEGVSPERRPERGLLELRRALGCYANLRPIRVPPALVPYSAVRDEIVAGTDLLIVRELAGGLYYGEPRGFDDGGPDAHGLDARGPDQRGGRAWNTLTYTGGEIERIARMAFELAGSRRGKVTSVDKSNVLEVSRLWRRTVTEVAADYPDVALEHMLVDRAAMELILRPAHFDVLLMGNLFGDILSDEAAGLAGSLGVLGSASLGGRTDLYEPVHGSAPDIAGTGRANPMGAIASLAMMLRHTFGLEDAASAMEGAVDRALQEGRHTADLVAYGDGSAIAVRPLSTADFVATVLSFLGAPKAASKAASTSEIPASEIPH